MDINILKIIEKEHTKKRPKTEVGDTVKLHLKIKEGNKERIQIFTGVIIGIKGVGLGQTLTVRKISYGIGVEKIVPVHSNMLEKIEVVKRGTVRSSKLFYLRQRVGRKALKVGNSKEVYMTDEIEVPTVGEEVETQEKET